MFLSKLKVVVGVALVVVALGAGGVAYRSADAQTVQPSRRAEGKPQTELEALRREVELLRLNLLVVLEKVRAQEAELRTLRAQPKPTTTGTGRVVLDLDKDGWPDLYVVPDARRPDPAQQAEAALKALRAAKDDAARQRAVDVLERALRQLREQMRPRGDTTPQPGIIPEVKKP
jgi:hypothetical protein